MNTHESIASLALSRGEGIRISEIRYRRLFESARDGILILDAQAKKITDVNPFMSELLGYTKKEFLGKELWEIGLLKDEDASIAAFKELQENDFIRYEDLPLKTKDGRKKEVEFVSNVYLEGDTKVVQCNIRDITERKSVENLRRDHAIEIKYQHERLDNVIANVPGIVWETWLDPESPNHHNYVSGYVETMIGYTVEEWLAIPDFWLAIVHPDDKAKAMLNAANNFKSGLNGKNGVSGINEFRWITKDGNTVWVEAQSLTITDDKKEPIGTRGVYMDITSRKNANRSLRAAEAKYRNLVESSPAIIYLAKETLPFTPVYVSPNVSELGFTDKEWLKDPNKWQNLIHETDIGRVKQTLTKAMERGESADLEYRTTAIKGKVRWIHEKGFFVIDALGNRVGWQGVIVDVTETKELEQQLRQAQKLESIGLLAGGIAHDFNNMLTAINGYCDLTLRQLPDDHPVRGNIEEIRKAGLRSADLTYQLLAFSRKLILRPVPLDINFAITDTIKMLRRVIGEDLEIVPMLDISAGAVLVDPGQFAQIIMNLAVNARDSMPEGGSLTISTSNFLLSKEQALEQPDVPAGEYVLVAVSDTGTGIAADVIEHIFDPFYTTKEIGRGTGLGLSTLYGIVRQSDGHVEVESEVGKGTTFKIYLPRIVEPGKAPSVGEAPFDIAKGTETVLLVEDEPLVRKLIVEFLESSGYTVIQASNGEEALAICDTGDHTFDLLITDVVMPHMGGRALAAQIWLRMPLLPVLFTSGYTDETLVRGALASPNTAFLQKPFIFDTFVGQVREILDGAALRKTKRQIRAVEIKE